MRCWRTKLHWASGNSKQKVECKQDVVTFMIGNFIHCVEVLHLRARTVPTWVKFVRSEHLPCVIAMNRVTEPMRWKEYELSRSTYTWAVQQSRNLLLKRNDEKQYSFHHPFPSPILYVLILLLPPVTIPLFPLVFPRVTHRNLHGFLLTGSKITTQFLCKVTQPTWEYTVSALLDFAYTQHMVENGIFTFLRENA